MEEEEEEEEEEDDDDDDDDDDDVFMQSSWSHPTKPNQESNHSIHATSIQQEAEDRSHEKELARTPCANGLTPSNFESCRTAENVGGRLLTLRLPD